jgi:hypothetical protein
MFFKVRHGSKVSRKKARADLRQGWIQWKRIRSVAPVSVSSRESPTLVVVALDPASTQTATSDSATPAPTLLPANLQPGVSFVSAFDGVTWYPGVVQCVHTDSQTVSVAKIDGSNQVLHDVIADNLAVLELII